MAFPKNILGVEKADEFEPSKTTEKNSLKNIRILG